ncbi:hypothetical protein BDZ94DRAFT_1304781 [Collybia nuda]|uniref:Mediator of RNA polymerase II transcription subunit 19 n=1 Tax=Collybia nuda TaxID=64659 RepID=A0A9P6CPW4_9AGAR|nr:hypothetical protein BDZ94DRAFT_1304781 [Collybia nuda]
MNGESTNAIAGPSNPRTSPPPSSSPPHIFFPPPAPPQTHPVYLSSTQDLLARFALLPAYDKYVRPFAAPGETGLDQTGPVPPNPGVGGMLDKGKGKEVAETLVSVGIVDNGDGDDDDGPGGKGEKRKKNNYKHLIKGIPGKHSLKKDDYLSTIMQIPPKQRIPIMPFDVKTQRDAFTVSLEGLKGWNPSALVLESAQAREDRKKRKELKRLAKLQQAQSANPIIHPQPIQAPIPTSTGSSTINRNTPTSIQNGSTVPRPGSAVPRPGSTKPTLAPVQVPVGRVSTPFRTGGGSSGAPLRSAGTATPTNTTQNPFISSMDHDKRGKKRDRDGPSGIAVNGLMINGHGAGNLVNSHAHQTTNARAGMDGIRPRPVKKQRMVSVTVILSLLSPFLHLGRYFIFRFWWLTSAIAPGYPGTSKGCNHYSTAYSAGCIKQPLDSVLNRFNVALQSCNMLASDSMVLLPTLPTANGKLEQHKTTYLRLHYI